MEVVFKKSYVFMTDDCYYFDLYSVDGVVLYDTAYDDYYRKKFAETLNGSKSEALDCFSSLYYDLMFGSDCCLPYAEWIFDEMSENIYYEYWLNRKNIYVKFI